MIIICRVDFVNTFYESLYFVIVKANNFSKFLFFEYKTLIFSAFAVDMDTKSIKLSLSISSFEKLVSRCDLQSAFSLQFSFDYGT